MHLVYQALDKKTIPVTLPNELRKSKMTAYNSCPEDGGFVANFPTEFELPPVPPPILPMARLPTVLSTDLIIQQDPATYNWVVSTQDKMRYDSMFKTSDLDNDGLVSGIEIKDVFLQSGIPNLCLAQIWGLCDTKQSGKLTSEQFALAMWMVDRKRNGIDPPNSLAPNMVPPSLRLLDKMANDDSLKLNEPAQPTTYSNPELAMISKEIEELAKERRSLENDISQKEADIRIKSGEVRSLQVRKSF